MSVAAAVASLVGARNMACTARAVPLHGRAGVQARSSVCCALPLIAMTCAGCASLPRGTAAVDSVDIEGNRAVSAADIEEKIATTASPRFLGLFPGIVYDYSIFDRGVLARDLARVERYYRARGFYEARVRAGRVRTTGNQHVAVTIEVEEGRPVLLHDARIEGLDGLPEDDAAAIRAELARSLKTGTPFEEEPFHQAGTAMRRALTDRGYAWATVDERADVDPLAHQADLVFTVRPGPRAVFGPIHLVGLGPLPEAPVRRAIDIAPDERYSSSRVEAAQRAVLDLGTFNFVEITPEAHEPPPADAAVPLVVRLRPQKLREVILGAGLELDSIRSQLHLHVGWEHKNLFGGLRHFTVDFRPGIDLYPTRLPTLQAPTAALPEARLRLELRQPSFLEARTNGVLRQELNVYPVLLSPKVDPQAAVLGYLEHKGSLSLDRTFGSLYLSPGYDLQFNDLFAYVGSRDPDLRGMTLSYATLLAQLDLRDDAIRPHRGLYVQSDVQVAGLGGDARDLRIRPEVRGYVPLGTRVTLAGRAALGLLFPFNYGNAAKAASEGGPGAVDRAAWVRDIELFYLRGFFSGGPSSNRGYPASGVGPHGAVPFFDPGLAARALARSCVAGSPDYDPVRCAVPLGGLTLWEASIELRFPIMGPMGGAAFCDASDVSPDRADVRLDHPHLSCGLGLRYDTPIGPVRVDVGYRIPGAQVPRGTDPQLEGDPGTIFGAPIAVAFGIGEAF